MEIGSIMIEPMLTFTWPVRVSVVFVASAEIVIEQLPASPLAGETWIHDSVVVTVHAASARKS